MTSFIHNIRYAVRQLRNQPSFAAVAVATLALGIGANTALFSVIDGVLLSRLPYPDPERLVCLSESKPNFEYGSISYPNSCLHKRGLLPGQPAATSTPKACQELERCAQSINARSTGANSN